MWDPGGKKAEDWPMIVMAALPPENSKKQESEISVWFKKERKRGIKPTRS